MFQQRYHNNLNSLKEMMSKVRGYIRSQHNASNNQERHPTSTVVTPPVAQVTGGQPCDQDEMMDYENETDTLRPSKVASKIGGLIRSSHEIKQEKHEDPPADSVTDRKSVV